MPRGYRLGGGVQRVRWGGRVVAKWCIGRTTDHMRGGGACKVVA